MPEAEPAAPSASRVARPRSAKYRVGVLAVALGVLVMLGGVVAVYVHTRNLPATTVPSRPSFVTTKPLPVAPSTGPSPPVWSPPPAVASAPAVAVAPSTPPAAGAPFPEDARAPVPVESGQPLWGPRSAPVTLTVFGNFQCPHTVAMLRVILAEKARRGDDLRLAFRYAPLSQYPVGEHAARALAALHAFQGEGAFWTVVQEIARRGEPLASASLASVIEASPAGFEAAARAQLESDAVLAANLFVRAAPVVFVNGLRLEGFHPQRALAEVIARERRAAGLALASGVAPPALYATRTRKNLLNLGDDPPERACVPANRSPARGPADALVTLVEFSDHDCELCRKGETLIARLLAAQPRDVRSVWKSFPLPQHRRARRAAVFALEARSQRGDVAFWTVTSALFAEKGADDAALLRAAERAGLDGEKLLAAADASPHARSLDADVRLAETLGVSAVPTYFFNGRRVDGVLRLAELEALVRQEVELARRVRKSGAGEVATLACGAHAQK